MPPARPLPREVPATAAPGLSGWHLLPAPQEGPGVWRFSTRPSSLTRCGDIFPAAAWGVFDHFPSSVVWTAEVLVFMWSSDHFLSFLFFLGLPFFSYVVLCGINAVSWKCLGVFPPLQFSGRVCVELVVFLS